LFSLCVFKAAKKIDFVGLFAEVMGEFYLKAWPGFLLRLFDWKLLSIYCSWIIFFPYQAIKNALKFSLQSTANPFEPQNSFVP